MVRLGALAGVVALLLSAHAVVASPIVYSRDGARVSTPHRKLTGKFLHISDFHPDLNYKPYTDPETSCHRGDGTAGHWGAETTDCDSPPSLVDATFAWIRDNVRDDVDFVVWTGDSARHDGDEDLPRRASEITETNRWIADKFVDAFAVAGSRGQGDAAAPNDDDDDDDDRRLSIPVIPSIGNNDFLPHNIFYAGPNRWLTEYLDVWRHFIPAEQRHSFQHGGYFAVEVIPRRLSVISLNTMYFFGRNAGVDGCADPGEPGYDHLEWLRVVLEDLRARGVKAILTGHVPPARTENKQLWDESCWQKYTLWMRQYRDVVSASLYGHMNIDHFILADAKEVGDDLGGRMRAEEDGWGWEEEEDNENSSPMAAAAAAASPVEGGFSVQGKGNYLADLRSGWSKIPAPQTAKSEASRGGHHAAHWSERYSLALVNPSIVPNYLPTMRIYEYNISGLEDAPVWRDDPDKFSYGKAEDAEEGGEDDDGLVGGEDDDDAVIAEDAAPHQELKRGLDLDLDLDALGRRNKGKGRKNKSKDSKKPHRPHDPKLIIPAPPSKTAGPGPAYSPQPLSLTGYTQLFANLTRLNMPEEVVDGEDQNSVDDDADAAAGGKKKKQPQHLPFEFEVEYSTFADKWYRVPDLTVRSYVRLAYRIARRAGGQPLEAVDQEFDEEFALDFGNEDGDNDGGDDGKSDVESADKKKKKKGKKGKSRASNKLWLRFLSRAFIGAVPREDLKQWDD